jgi:hypothetical protein
VCLCLACVCECINVFDRWNEGINESKVQLVLSDDISMQTMKKRLDGRNLLGVDHIHTLPPTTSTYLHTHSHTYARSARPAHFHHTPTTRHGTPRHNDRNRTPDAARKPPLQTTHETWRNPHPYREFQASARIESVKTHITRARVYPLSALRKRRHTNTAHKQQTQFRRLPICLAVGSSKQ